MTFLCIERVGSPELMLLSGEGLLRLRRYPPELITRLTAIARDLGVTPSSALPLPVGHRRAGAAARGLSDRMPLIDGLVQGAVQLPLAN